MFGVLVHVNGLFIPVSGETLSLTLKRSSVLWISSLNWNICCSKQCFSQLCVVSLCSLLTVSRKPYRTDVWKSILCNPWNLSMVYFQVSAEPRAQFFSGLMKVFQQRSPDMFSSALVYCTVLCYSLFVVHSSVFYFTVLFCGDVWGGRLRLSAFRGTHLSLLHQTAVFVLPA